MAKLLLAAYAEGGTSVESILDPPTLDLVVRACDYGGFGFHYCEGKALLTFLRDLRLPDADFDKQWTYIQKLILH